MRRFSILLTTLMIISVLLAACGAEETSTTVPSTNVPPVTLEATMTEESATEAPATDLTTTPVVPVTGEDNPSRVSNILDFTVWNQNGEQIGDVEDLVLDLDNSRISYVMIGTGGFLDIGDKEVLIPWDSLELQTTATGADQNAFILLADQEMLSNAPDVDVDTMLPGIGNPANDWDADLRNFWESGVVPEATESATTPAATDMTVAPEMTATTASSMGSGTVTGQGQKLQGVALASDVLGSTIMFGPQGGQGQGLGQATAESVATTAATAMPDTTATASSDSGVVTGNEGPTEGTVEDMIVDVSDGSLLYLVVDAPFTDGERWIPIPLGFLQWDASTESFIVRVDPNALQNAPFFESDQFPDTTMEGWDTDFSDFWQNNGGTGISATATP